MTSTSNTKSYKHQAGSKYSFLSSVQARPNYETAKQLIQMTGFSICLYMDKFLTRHWLNSDILTNRGESQEGWQVL